MTETSCDNDSLASEHERPVTRNHRMHAAMALSASGVTVVNWIQTGRIEVGVPFDDSLVDVAQAFADFEVEILTVPVTTVHGMEDSSVVCSLCGTEGDDGHTLRDCFKKYREREDAASSQVTAYLQHEIETLSAELAEAKTGYHALDKHWERAHEIAIDAVMEALSMPDATIPELLARIHEHRWGRAAPTLAVFSDGGETFVVAASPEDAHLVYRESIGLGDFDASGSWTRCPDDQVIKIKCYHHGEVGPLLIAPVDESGPGIATASRTAAEWLKFVHRGLLCTGDY